MLDDLKFIAQKDPYDSLGVAAGQPEQLLYKDFTFNAPNINHVNNIVLAGMGGSSLVGQICKTWWIDQLSVPFEIVRNYDLPNYVGKQTLLVASSYSGNTEETLSAVEAAHRLEATIIAVTSGGKLQQLANRYDFPVLIIPHGFQPRMTVCFSLRALAAVFDQLGLVSNAVKELEQAAAFLKPHVAQYVKELPTDQNRAKQLAQELMGRTIVVYAGPTLAPAAYKWKIDFNESSRNLATWNEVPELDHSELMGWTSHPIEKPFGVIELRSDLDHPRVNKRFDVMNKLLSGRMPKPFEVKAEGKTKIAQILWSNLLGSFVTNYLGILNGINPNSAETTEKFKQELGQP